MELPNQFKKENCDNIFIYHYVEELVSSFSEYIDETFKEEDISPSEFPFMVRIRFSEKTIQKELVKLFKLSEGYTAKLLRKFEDLGYIKRHEDPENRRQKIVELTPTGVEKTDELIKIIDEWETKQTKKLTAKEVKLLKSLLFKLVSS